MITQPGIVPRVRSNENWRVPDVGVSCTPSDGGVEVPAPVLLIEILSPNNHAETRNNVWAYATIPSVQEILLVHSTRIEAGLLRRRGDGTWPEQPEIIEAGEYIDLDSIGFTVALSALYRTTSLAR